MSETYELGPKNPPDPRDIPPPVQPGMEEVPEVVPEKTPDITTINDTLERVRKGWTPDAEKPGNKKPTLH